MEKKKSVFDRLSAINVNDHVEKKKDLTYLSWAWAWSVTKKECPDASYKILPTEYDEALGFMCHSEVTIEGQTLEMWLPVMDGANKSMLKKAYTYKGTAWENGRKVQVEKTVDAATTFDINKTMMRCLVKNLAMFGLGIYIYAGEDLPETEVSAPAPPPAKVAPTDQQFSGIVQYLNGTPEQKNTAKEALKKYTLTNDQKEIIEGLI